MIKYAHRKFKERNWRKRVNQQSFGHPNSPKRKLCEHQIQYHQIANAESKIGQFIALESDIKEVKRKLFKIGGKAGSIVGSLWWRYFRQLSSLQWKLLLFLTY
jgi:hypothetical protein